MKIPFDITKRPQIESGEYKVETNFGNPAIVMDWEWNLDGKKCLVVKIPGDGKDNAFLYDYTGKRAGICPDLGPERLVVITPDEELSEFEKGLVDFYRKRNELVPDKDGVFNRHDLDELLHKTSSELLALARKELIKQGYIIEKKAFHDAVEKFEPEVKKEASANIDLANFVHDLGERYPEVSFAKLTRIAKAAYDYGKAEALEGLNLALKAEFDRGVAVGEREALKDLPRWEKNESSIVATAVKNYSLDGEPFDLWIVHGKRKISIKSLEKLPGFKED